MVGPLLLKRWQLGTCYAKWARNTAPLFVSGRGSSQNLIPSHRVKSPFVTHGVLLFIARLAKIALRCPVNGHRCLRQTQKYTETWRDRVVMRGGRGRKMPKARTARSRLLRNKCRQRRHLGRWGITIGHSGRNFWWGSQPELHTMHGRKRFLPKSSRWSPFNLDEANVWQRAAARALLHGLVC